jgi:carbohydrate diacid regulator
MQLNNALAHQIVDKAQSILKRDVLLSDLAGQLIASSVGSSKQFVPEALSVAQTGHTVTAVFHDKSTKWWPFVYEDQTIAVFGLTVDTGPITQEAITLLQGLAEVIVYQHFLLDKIQSAERVRSDFLKNTLTAATIDPEDIYRQADILQLALRQTQSVILIEISGLEDEVNAAHPDLSSEERRLELDARTEAISRHIRQSFRLQQDNLVAYLGENQFVLLKGINGDHLTTLNTIRYLTEQGELIQQLLIKLQPRSAITIGVGQYYPDLGGLRKSYQDAKLALEVGTKVWGNGRVYHIKRVGMFITLANTSADRKAELAHQILSPLLRDDQLFKTVQAFLASGLNLTDAAEKLHIHRNTLIYRLDKTKKLIHLDPRHFDDALQIKLGLMFYQETPA